MILMISKIDVAEFRNRLKENTKNGSPKLKIPLGFFSIFIHNPECFYGNFDNSKFELTTNSNFSPTFYFLKGTYKNSEKSLIVNYSVEPAGKIRIAWVKYFPIIAFILCNCIFYFEAKPPIEIYIIFNVLIIFISLFSRWNLKWKSKRMVRKFNKIFEIIE